MHTLVLSPSTKIALSEKNKTNQKQLRQVVIFELILPVKQKTVRKKGGR